jgi:hypothetical protein
VNVQDANWFLGMRSKIFIVRSYGKGILIWQSAGEIMKDLFTSGKMGDGVLKFQLMANENINTEKHNVSVDGG